VALWSTNRNGRKIARGYDGRMFAGDSDRERAAATLKESYVGGRLTLDELSERTELVLSARSRAELRAALSGLPWLSEELAERGRSVAHAVARGTLVVALTGAWLLFSFVLLLVLGLVLLLQGASGEALLGFLLAWLVPTYLLSRLWRRSPQRHVG
jgi:hypothetical protein